MLILFTYTIRYYTNSLHIWHFSVSIKLIKFLFWIKFLTGCFLNIINTFKPLTSHQSKNMPFLLIYLLWGRSSWSHPRQHGPFWKATVVTYILPLSQLLFEHKFQSVQEESLHPCTGFDSHKHEQQTHQSVNKQTIINPNIITLTWTRHMDASRS